MLIINHKTKLSKLINFINSNIQFQALSLCRAKKHLKYHKIPQRPSKNPEGKTATIGAGTP